MRLKRGSAARHLASSSNATFFGSSDEMTYRQAG
jgi:hypothetical protein